MNYYITDSSGRITSFAPYKFDDHCEETEREIIRVGGELMFTDEISPENLVKLKEEKVNVLWENYKKHQQKYVDAEDLTLATLCASHGSVKGKAVQLWVMGLWSQYYSIKDVIQSAADRTALESIDLTAESYGAPLYTIRELNEEAAAALNLETQGA